MKAFILLLICMAFSSCRHAGAVRVTDSHGRTLEGALVYAEQISYFPPGRMEWAGTTDREGNASLLVSRDGRKYSRGATKVWAIAPGYTSTETSTIGSMRHLRLLTPDELVSHCRQTGKGLLANVDIGDYTVGSTLRMLDSRGVEEPAALPVWKQLARERYRWAVRRERLAARQ